MEIEKPSVSGGRTGSGEKTESASRTSLFFSAAPVIRFEAATMSAAPASSPARTAKTKNR